MNQHIFLVSKESFKWLVFLRRFQKYFHTIQSSMKYRILQKPFFFLQNALKKNYWIFSQISFFTWKNKTYIHNWSLHPSARIIDPGSHTSYVVCGNFIHKWWDLQFKIDSDRQIFWETCHGNFILTLSFCQKSAERKSMKKYILYFVLMSGLGHEPWLFVR